MKTVRLKNQIEEPENDEMTQLQIVLDQLAAENEELKSKVKVKSENIIVKEFKNSVQNQILNVVRDPGSTITGVGMAIGVAYANYPNFDSGTIMEMFGFGYMGATSNNKIGSIKNVKSEKREFG